MTLDALLTAALAEDLGHGDLTTEATIPRDRNGEGHVLAKEPLVLAGQRAAARTFQIVARELGYAESDIAYQTRADDAARVEAGTVVALVQGPLRVILVGERLALNLLMRMCGIATNTARYVAAAGDSGLRVVDTRKTTPLHRDLEKYAVRCGGGFNHRHALFDGVLVKDNHIRAVGSLTEAVRLARAGAHHLVRVEVEARTLDEVDEAVQSGADALLLDNFDDAGLAEAVRRARAARPGLVLEASGNMNPERIARIKDFGLDLVSAGGLVHQARWCDLSLKIR